MSLRHPVRELTCLLKHVKDLTACLVTCHQTHVTRRVLGDCNNSPNIVKDLTACLVTCDKTHVTRRVLGDCNNSPNMVKDLTARVLWHDIWLRESDCVCLVTWHLTARVGLLVSCDMTFDCASWTACVLWHDIWLREVDCASLVTWHLTARVGLRGQLSCHKTCTRAVKCHVTRHAVGPARVQHSLYTKSLYVFV